MLLPLYNGQMKIGFLLLLFIRISPMLSWPPFGPCWTLQREAGCCAHFSHLHIFSGPDVQGSVKHHILRHRFWLKWLIVSSSPLELFPERIRRAVSLLWVKDLAHTHRPWLRGQNVHWHWGPCIRTSVIKDIMMPFLTNLLLSEEAAW